MNCQIAHHHAYDGQPPAGASKLRILIVDDDEMIRSLHETVLCHAGYGTECACDGEEALVMLAMFEFDLVLTDCSMPVLDGVGLVRALRSAGSRIPVMMVSGTLANAGELPADVRDEIAVALPKPARVSELLAGVARASRRVPSGQTAAPSFAAADLQPANSSAG